MHNEAFWPLDGYNLVGYIILVIVVLALGINWLWRRKNTVYREQLAEDTRRGIAWWKEWGAR